MQSFSVTIDLLNSENFKVDIAQLCHELQFCNFMQVNNKFKENTPNAIVFKLQLIYTTLRI